MDTLLRNGESLEMRKLSTPAISLLCGVAIDPQFSPLVVKVDSKWSL